MTVFSKYKTGVTSSQGTIIKVPLNSEISQLESILRFIKRLTSSEGFEIEACIYTDNLVNSFVIRFSLLHEAKKRFLDFLWKLSFDLILDLQMQCDMNKRVDDLSLYLLWSCRCLTK